MEQVYYDILPGHNISKNGSTLQRFQNGNIPLSESALGSIYPCGVVILSTAFPAQKFELHYLDGWYYGIIPKYFRQKTKSIVWMVWVVIHKFGNFLNGNTRAAVPYWTGLQFLAHLPTPILYLQISISTKYIPLYRVYIFSIDRLDVKEVYRTLDTKTKVA